MLRMCPHRAPAPHGSWDGPRLRKGAVLLRPAADRAAQPRIDGAARTSQGPMSRAGTGFVKAPISADRSLGRCSFEGRISIMRTPGLLLGACVLGLGLSMSACDAKPLQLVR